MKNLCFIILAIFVCIKISAQDSHFSQFYSAPQYIGPSFAGATIGSRAVANYRLEWAFIQPYNTSSIAVDHNLSKYNSGIGLTILGDLSGSTRLLKTGFGIQYAYGIPINRELSIRPGVEFSYNRVGINYNRLVFGDQLFYELDQSRERPTEKSKGYLDAASSVLAFSKKYWGGITVKHLFRPNESLTTIESKVPINYAFYGGGKFTLNSRLGRRNEESISVAAYYHMQDKFDQMDIGAYWMRLPLVVGFWYRGLPGIKKNPALSLNQDAFVLLFGYRKNNFGVAYSYDITISRLFADSGGTHEISLSYLFNQDEKPEKQRKKIIVPCPRF